VDPTRLSAVECLRSADFPGLSPESCWAREAARWGAGGSSCERGGPDAGVDARGAGPEVGVAVEGVDVVGVDVAGLLLESECLRGGVCTAWCRTATWRA
jgi:hypothetical protein